MAVVVARWWWYQALCNTFFFIPFYIKEGTTGKKWRGVNERKPGDKGDGVLLRPRDVATPAPPHSECKLLGNK